MDLNSLLQKAYHCKVVEQWTVDKHQHWPEFVESLGQVRAGVHVEIC